MAATDCKVSMHKLQSAMLNLKGKEISRDFKSRCLEDRKYNRRCSRNNQMTNPSTKDMKQKEQWRMFQKHVGVDSL